MFSKLLVYAKKYRKYALLTPLCVVGEVLLEITIPVLMSWIVDIGIGNKDIGYVLKIGVLMILASLCSLTCGALGARFASKAGMGFGSELRNALFGHIQDFSFSNIDRYSAPSLITRMTTDVNNVQMTFMMMIRIMVRAPVMLVGATFMAFQINNSLVTVFLVAIPILAALLGTIAAVTFPRFMSMLKKYDALNAGVQENLIAVRVVKAFAREEYEIKKFDDINNANMKASIHADKVLSWNMPIMQLTMYACIIAILWFGGNLIAVGDMQTGELIGFISYVTQILMSLMMIAQVFVMFVITRASAARLVEVIHEEIDITDTHIEHPAEPQDGSICFENVSFKYRADSSEYILKDVNLQIQSGQTVGIIGGTGSAKTSLVQLIPRLYDADSGRVCVGGHDVRDYRLYDLRETVGMVLQKNVLFSGSIRDNLRWGNEQATDEEIEAACRAAQAHDFIMSFPDGYDTDLGQEGVNVSGGQKQRLCIARALLKKPAILILDDSTSAVDTATDAKIREAFRGELKNTTKLIIAQRISSVADADLIIVLDDGRIIATGTHEELLKTCEIYREVYQSQQRGVA